MLNDLPGLPGGQQEGTGSNGEPSGGLIPEAGQLLTLGLVQLRERSLPEQSGPVAAQHVHDRRHQPLPRRRPAWCCPDRGRLDSFDSLSVDIEVVKLNCTLI